MNKALYKITLSLSLLGLAVTLPSAAQAAVDKTTVVPCRSGNTECWPAAFTFAPNGNIFYAERYTGQIRVYNPTKNTDKLWKTISDVASDGEQGVLGLVLDPRWPEKKWVYVYYTYSGSDTVKNRITRWRQKDDGTFEKDRLITVAANTNHNGGVIKFGPDGKLYVVVGDTGDSALAQDLSSYQGKVLRLNKDGSIPNDNPFDGSVPFFSYGHRNMYGLAFDPLDNTPNSVEVWLTENGPECNDELNFVEKSLNYGWGEDASCPDTNNSGLDPVEPEYSWSSTVAVTGAAFCNDCSLGDEVEGNIIVGAWNTGALTSFALNQARTGVSATEELYTNESGILGVVAGIDSKIYFSDNTGIYRLEK